MAMEVEKYEVNIEHFGIYQREGDNVFEALDLLKQELNPATPFRILSAFIIKSSESKVEITDILNGTCYAVSQPTAQ
jgi:hypothetical protein